MVRQFFLFLALALIVGACGNGESANVSPATTSSLLMVDEGSWYIHERWPHDGQQIESANFIVYSDGASAEARQELADAAEKLWIEVLDELEVTSEMLTLPAGRSKIDIFAYYDYFPQHFSGRAYYGGLLIWSPDHPLRRFDRAGYEPTLKHELIHELQWMLTDAEGTFDTWFIEGLPLALAYDPADARQPVRDLDRLDDLTSEYGTLNPISVKRYSQIPDAESGDNFYYPMFQLAFEYLLDDAGLGRSPIDARDVMIDVAQGEAFSPAVPARSTVNADPSISTRRTVVPGGMRLTNPVPAAGPSRSAAARASGRAPSPETARDTGTRCSPSLKNITTGVLRDQGSQRTKKLSEPSAARLRATKPATNAAITSRIKPNLFLEPELPSTSSRGVCSASSRVAEPMVTAAPSCAQPEQGA